MMMKVLIISKLNIVVQKAHQEDDTTAFALASSTAAAAAADPQTVVGLCARVREPEGLEGGGGPLLFQGGPLVVHGG